jgi:hypothetical protein
MAKTLTLCDEYGIIYEALKILPDDKLKICFLEALAELEDSECHRTRKGVAEWNYEFQSPSPVGEGFRVRSIPLGCRSSDLTPNPFPAREGEPDS